MGRDTGAGGGTKHSACRQLKPCFAVKLIVAAFPFAFLSLHCRRRFLKVLHESCFTYWGWGSPLEWCHL